MIGEPCPNLGQSLLLAWNTSGSVHLFSLILNTIRCPLAQWTWRGEREKQHNRSNTSYLNSYRHINAQSKITNSRLKIISFLFFFLRLQYSITPHFPSPLHTPLHPIPALHTPILTLSHIHGFFFIHCLYAHMSIIFLSMQIKPAWYKKTNSDK